VVHRIEVIRYYGRGVGWVLVAIVAVAIVSTEMKISQRTRGSKESTARTIRGERWWGVKLGLLIALVVALIAAASH
jgi:hypothetical protein